jgi:hypothetical protein
MPRKPIDLERVRRADAELVKLLAEHPELREHNPERQAALQAWLEAHLEEGHDDGTATEICRRRSTL